MLFLVILMFGVWSTTFSIGKLSLLHASPIFSVGVRMVVASLLIVSYLAIRSPSVLKIKRHHVVPLLGLGLVAIYLANTLEFIGLDQISATKTCFLYGLSPIFSALFSYIQLKEKITPRKTIGTLLGFLAFVPNLLLEGTNFSFGWGEISVLGAVITAMYGWVLMRSLMKTGGLSPLTANAYSMMIGGILSLFHSRIYEDWSPWPVKEEGFMIWAISTSVILLLSQIISYNAYGFFLKKMTATFLSLVGLLSPFFVALSSWLLLREPPPWILLGSTLVVIVSLYLAYEPEIKGHAIPEKETAFSS
ncbi:MAG: DMT family transporter [Chlamydiota bacterium]|nr:DMT family transporter [Chlamydiota bacterium]